MDTILTVDQFIGNYDFLSMKYPSDIKIESVTFKNAIVAFYAMKATDKNAWPKFARLNPAKAREKYKKIPTTDQYLDEDREKHLYIVNKAKFDQNLLLKARLLDTKGMKLINTVPYSDYWIGIHRNQGDNMLGKVLMKIRDDYLKEIEDRTKNIK